MDKDKKYYPDTEENFGINSPDRKYYALRVENARLSGEFIDFCRGLLVWNLPEELRLLIKEQVKRLETKNTNK